MELGQLGADKITGFTGVVVSKTEHLGGSVEVALAPRKLDKDGNRRKTEWFRETRVEQMMDTGQ